MTTTSLGSVKRYRTRYGRTTKYKAAQMDSLYNGRRLKCPYCSKDAVKRTFVGVWECRHCAVKFSGRAYTPEKSVQAVAEEA
ncbi:50S ribosomal protein L37ae [Candidatus Woesearchaeota archaeon]|nr:50S ribosomal protein L37ae [Candidatus Woesearchaeota archaeon]